MSTRLAVAMAGAGMISRHHLMAWSKRDDARVVAVADPIRERAAERAREFDIAGVFDNVGAMLAGTDVQAVDIASPVDTHVSIARLCAQRGIAVLCQKPVAPTLTEARALSEVAAGVPFMVHENWRFRTPYRLAREWIRGGRIGIVHRFSIACESAGLLAAPGEVAAAVTRQPFFAQMPRLMIFEVLIHHLDLARALCGELSVVAASMTHTAPSVCGEDRAIVMLSGENSIGTVTGDYAVPGRSPIASDMVEIIGNTGRILFDGETMTLFDVGGEAAVERFDRPMVYQSAFDNAIGHFVERLHSHAGFETSLDDNLSTFALVEAAYARSGERENHAGPRPAGGAAA